MSSLRISQRLIILLCPYNVYGWVGTTTYSGHIRTAHALMAERSISGDTREDAYPKMRPCLPGSNAFRRSRPHRRLCLHARPAEIRCVPRPTPPARMHYEFIDAFDADDALNIANLDVPDYRRLRRRATKLVDAYVATLVDDYEARRWKRGRKNERDRNALIKALAKLFHEESGWEAQYGEANYRAGLKTFLRVILTANYIPFAAHRTFNLRVLAPPKGSTEPDYRKPPP
jgi:hypothetical protein